MASAAVLTGLTQTLVDVSLTQAAGVAGAAVAGEGGKAVFAGAIVAGIRVALIDVSLTVLPRVTWRAKRKDLKTQNYETTKANDLLHYKEL